MDESDFENQDPKATAELVRLLSMTAELQTRLHFVVTTRRRPSSPAAEDEDHPLGHHAVILATEAVAAAVEHLEVWRRLLTVAQVQPYGAHMTLIRGALEGSVTCRWLVDASVPSVERVRRGVALLRDDYINRRDFDRDMGIRAVPSPGKTAAARVKDLERDYRAAKVKPGAAMGVTSRCRAYAVPSGDIGVAAFRLLSAFAHSHQWAGLGMQLEEVPSAPAVKGGRIMKASADDSLAVSMTTIGMETALAAINDLERHAGLRTP